MAGGEGEADRAVAEEVEGAAEAGVGVDRRRGRSRPCGSRRRSRSGRGGSRSGSAASRVAAASHSASLTTKVDCGNSEIAEVWSRCMWVITTIGISPGSRPRLRSCAGTSSPGSRRRLAEAVAEAAEVLRAVGGDRGVQAGVDEDRAGARVADQEGRDRDHVRRLGRRAAPAASFRVRKRPPGLTIIARGKSTWPAISGSTTTVAPGVPPASGSCSGLRLDVNLHRGSHYAGSGAYRLARRWLKARIRRCSGTVCSTARSASSPAPAAASGARRRWSWRASAPTVVGCGRRAEPLAETAELAAGLAGSLRARGARHPRGGAGRALLRRPARAPRPPRRPRQQRRRPVPQPGRGDHARRASAR